MSKQLSKNTLVLIAQETLVPRFLERLLSHHDSKGSDAELANKGRPAMQEVRRQSRNHFRYSNLWAEGGKKSGDLQAGVVRNESSNPATIIVSK